MVGDDFDDNIENTTQTNAIVDYRDSSSINSLL